MGDLVRPADDAMSDVYLAMPDVGRGPGVLVLHAWWGRTSQFTAVADRLAQEGRILDTPWENYTLYDVNIKPKSMSPQDLEQGILSTFKRVYAPQVAHDKAIYFRNIFASICKEK